MSYRFNALDIIVGVGMSAIMFGAILFFVATAGTLQAVSPQAVSAEQFSDDPSGMVWLQPALGQAIVDRMLLESRFNAAQADAVSEWNRATMAYHDLQARFDDPVGGVARLAVAMPAQHLARVQGVLGRSIVNFTKRGVRSGLLSGDRLDSAFNTSMIGKTEATGLRMNREFEASWQPMLGQAIIDAVRRYRQQSAAVQERMGAAIAHLTSVEAASGEALGENQRQLAGAIMAAVRTDALSDRLQLLAALESLQDEPAARSTQPASWPDIPLGLLIAAVVGLGTIFMAGLLLSAMAREAKAQAERNREMSRWVYRMAS
ncbi:hypothetical protein [Nitrospira moscoviensis]|uniref:Uncharacterized protein n=1 Tax=Nitrospira moscoviensis TaxID=42253 RepID=A0A0K2GH89_NITMO|nr:hypothetical protein [Nitrospira moscoviensis]ALA60325.1 conserved exported protein of unknown function [Nitrospira moscoviensis]